MNIIELIEKKKHCKALSYQELKYFVDKSVSKELPDYQISAMLMAIWFNKLQESELLDYTKCLVESGDTVNFKFPGTSVDKHSSGGVGDKVSLIIGPILASFGFYVAKMSGRGLAQTGGTIDKMESIPNLKTDLSLEKLKEIVEVDKFAISSATLNLVPGDKVIYALRDVTATVDSIDLIAASIMSKKLAFNNDIIVLDVKCGSGSFCKELETAKDLAKKMLKIANHFNRKVIIEVTDMNQPLGNYIGNALEIKEVLNCLNGNWSTDLYQLILSTISELLITLKLASNKNEVEKMLQKKISNKECLNNFYLFVKNQEGDVDYCKKLLSNQKNWDTKYHFTIKAPKKGYFRVVNCENIGWASCYLGAGRIKKNDVIDMNAGIIILKKNGNFVNFEEPIFELYSNKEISQNILNILYNSFIIEEKSQERPVLIKKIYKNF
ncbi:thymidine phosphorylase [symbiont of Argiope bruennichi]|uniref:thymidine phosphorylase n=1 Tax=symbiont of Argiope bruennichi TaxID=2810479 RepID=UPI003DA628CB